MCRIKEEGKRRERKKKIVTKKAWWSWRKTVPERIKLLHVGVPRTAIGWQVAPVHRIKPHGRTDNM
jgi:hypothetical protein